MQEVWPCGEEEEIIMVELSSLNPFANFNIGLGTLGNVLLLFFLGLVIIGLTGVAIWFWWDRRRYIYKIPLTKKVGNQTIKIAEYKARRFPIGRAGDNLWFVKGVKKYISPATLQTAPNEFTHHEREDGEWINVSYPDVDAHMRQMKVKYIHQDMRSQRLATDRLLEQRLLKKKFWEQWGHIIMTLIFFLVVTVSMVVIFWQWGNIVDKISLLVDKLDTIQKAQSSQGNSGIVPAMIMLLWRFKKDVQTQSKE